MLSPLPGVLALLGMYVHSQAVRQSRASIYIVTVLTEDRRQLASKCSWDAFNVVRTNHREPLKFTFTIVTHREQPSIVS